MFDTSATGCARFTDDCCMFTGSVGTIIDGCWMLRKVFHAKHGKFFRQFLYSRASKFFDTSVTDDCWMLEPCVLN